MSKSTLFRVDILTLRRSVSNVSISSHEASVIKINLDVLFYSVITAGHVTTDGKIAKYVLKATDLLLICTAKFRAQRLYHLGCSVV